MGWGTGREEKEGRVSLASAPVPALLPQTSETQELPAEEARLEAGDLNG